MSSPLIASFVFCFLAELGDKTLYAVVLLATRNRILPTLLGGWAAFLVQGLIAVALGSLLRMLPQNIIHWGAALVFAGCGAWLLFVPSEDDGAGDAEGKTQSGWQQFLSAFGLVFVAEFGDATQIGTATLVAKFGAPVLVFIGATLGLWAGTVIAVIVGRTVGKRIPSKWLRRGAGIVFITLGVATAWRG